MKEIDVDLALTEGVRAQVSLHSFLNVLNILFGELQLFRLDLGRSDVVPESLALAGEVLDAVRAGSVDGAMLDRLTRLGEVFERESREALDGSPGAQDDARTVAANVLSIIKVTNTRIAEFAAREEGGMNWQNHSVEQLRTNFGEFFAAVEQNSRGRYGIVYNVASQEERDYLVSLTIDGEADGSIRMPPVLQDVLRDLLANARKYTSPGGEIKAGLSNDGEELRLVVDDSGMGIPEDEIDRVVTFGYRASNVQRLPTRGGGFGLTKAYDVTRQLGGRFFLESREGQGTRVRILIPVPSGGDPS